MSRKSCTRACYGVRRLTAMFHARDQVHYVICVSTWRASRRGAATHTRRPYYTACGCYVRCYDIYDSSTAVRNSGHDGRISGPGGCRIVTLRLLFTAGVRGATSRGLHARRHRHANVTTTATARAGRTNLRRYDMLTARKPTTAAWLVLRRRARRWRPLELAGATARMRGDGVRRVERQHALELRYDSVTNSSTAATGRHGATATELRWRGDNIETIADYIARINWRIWRLVNDRHVWQLCNSYACGAGVRCCCVDGDTVSGAATANNGV